jgi:hypothetical protein
MLPKLVNEIQTATTTSHGCRVWRGLWDALAGYNGFIRTAEVGVGFGYATTSHYMWGQEGNYYSYI